MIQWAEGNPVFQEPQVASFGVGIAASSQSRLCFLLSLRLR
jgi:hypothetical protein